MICIEGGKITTPFDEMRPLTLPPEKRWHKHSAVDVSGGNGIVISPVKGTAKAYLIYDSRIPWLSTEKKEILDIPWKDYFYDIFGGIIVVVEEKTNILHLFTHFWAETLFDQEQNIFMDEHIESNRSINHIISSRAFKVQVGDRLAKMGSAGQSSGPHVHWEKHHNYKKLDTYEDRLNPEDDI